MSEQVAVLGAGNWGTTLANLIGRNGHDVRLWTRQEKQAKEINERHTNESGIHGLQLSERVRATTRLDEAIGGARLVLFVVPSSAMREVARAAGDVLRPDQLVLHAAKGLEQGSHKRMSEILMEETCARQIGVLSGPNLAPEIAAGKPAGTVIASPMPGVVHAWRKVLSCEKLLVFGSDDVTGVELAGALKNIVALAAGAAAQMDVGENAKALLVTRGQTEIMRLSVAMGADPVTFSGLAGIGDLMATCASPQSRNHRVGAALARGEKLSDILKTLGMVAEGVNTSRAARELCEQHRIEAPLFDRIYRVVHEGLAPAVGLRQLMRLPAGHDAR